MTSSEVRESTEKDPEVESVLVDTDTLPDHRGWSVDAELVRSIDRYQVSDGPLDESTIPDWLRR